MAGKGVLDLIHEGASPDMLQVLSRFMSQRAELREQQDVIADRLSTLNTAIGNLMLSLDVKSFEGPEGTLVYKPAGTSKLLNKKLLVTNLMERGVDPTVISECVEKATGSKVRPCSVSFYKAGEKEHGDDS